MIGPQATLDALEAELAELDKDIARLRATRERATYKLEQALRERERLSRHLSARREGLDV